MFLLTGDPLVPFDLADPAAGGYVIFEGRVRDFNEGRVVTALEYEAFETMAVSEGEAIVREALASFPILDARCSHRVGRLAVGDVAIAVAVAAAHRSEAFEACRFIVDEVKHRLPIWKKEFYADGETAWVNCRCAGDREPPRELPEGPTAGGAAGVAVSPLHLSRAYSRQTILPEIGEEGQRKLAQARVLVVGAGGLGCPALQYLAAAGVGTLGICEGDELEASNLHRQILYAVEDIGKPKAELAAKVVRRLNPAIAVNLHDPIAEACGHIVEDYDLILDCTDNFAAKFLLSDLAVKHGKPLVQASIYRFEGQIHTYVPGVSACLRCLWPQTPDPGCTGTCAEVGVMGFTAGFFGVLQAVEAVKLIVGFGENLAAHTLIVDLLDYGTRRICRNPDRNCPACGTAPNPARIEMPLNDMDPYEMTATTAVASDLPILDIREVCENPAPHPHIASRWRHIPMSVLDASLPELGGGPGYIVMCAHGVRSDRVVRQLRAAGFQGFYSLRGGDAELRRILGG